MNYTLHQLTIFCKVVDLKSITKASEELFLTQPAISIQLKKLQGQFEIPLFEIIGRKLFVTDFGYEIAEIAKKILSRNEEIKLSALKHKGVIGGTIKIAVVSTGKYVMPYFLDSFLKKYPDVDLRMDVTNRKDVIEQLSDNNVDFALVSVLPKDLRIESIQLMENKLFLVANDTALFAPNAKLGDILKKFPPIFREQGSATRMAMEAFFDEKEITLNKSLQLTSNEAVKQAIIAGLGCSVMPVIGIRNELELGELQIIPRKGLPKITNWHLVWLKDKRFSPATQAYVDFLRNEKKKIIRERFTWHMKY